MSFLEEPESQIDPTHTQYAEDYGFPPMLSETAHTQAQNRPRLLPNINESDSDEKILDVAAAATSSPTAQKWVLDSQVIVEETQFISVERDTQPSIEYDLSPISQRALDNIESVSTCLPPPMATFQPLERQSTPHDPKDLNFRFARPLNPNRLKLVRPMPGQIGPLDNEMTDLAPLMTTSHLISSSSSARTPLIYTLHSHGSPITTSRDKNACSNLPDTQNDPSCGPDYKEAINGEVDELKSQENYSQRVESPFDIAMMSEEVSSCTSRQSSVEPVNTATSTMRTQLVAALKSNKVTHSSSCGSSQLRRKAKPRSPPFVEEALGSDTRHMSRQIANKPAVAEKPSSRLNDPGSLTQREGRNQKQNCTDPGAPSNSSLDANIPERLPAQTSPKESEIIARDFSDDSSLAMSCEVEGLQHGALGRNLPDSGQPLRHVNSTNKPVSSSRQSDTSIRRHGRNKSTLSDLTSRPQIDKPPPLPEVSGIHSIRDSLNTQVYSRDCTRPKSAHHVQTIDQPVGGGQPPDSAAMLQMAAILATAEKEQREQGIARSHLQELEIEDLNRENAGFRDRIEVLSMENRELLNKVDDFRRRNERCRNKMNEITRAHKELFPAAKALDKRRFETLAECAKEMDTELLKKKALLSREWKSLFSEAQIKLDDQDKMIEVLSRDVDNRLLDLQRERNIRESLQRQLEEREKQEKELRSLLLAHQQSTIETLSGHKQMLKDLMNTGATSLMKLGECRAGIENIEENESKPISALIEVRELIISMSKSIEEKLLERQDFSTDLRNTGAEVLAELRNRLQLVDEDYAAQKKSNVAIVDLREENTELKERIETQERGFVSLETEISELKNKLQQCRAELATKSDDLGKIVVAVQEEATLRNQLENLQTSYSIAKDQVESATHETERARANLFEQENLALLNQQEIRSLRGRLEESEAKFSSFRAQKEAYIRQAKTEFATLRLQMERDFQARLAEDEVSHNDNISGLRRQVAEANANVDSTNRKAQNLEKLNLRHEIERNHLSTQVSVVTSELTILKDKSRLLDKGRDQIDSDLRASQSQLSQCVEKISELGSQSGTKALEFATRFDEIEDEIKRSGEAAETDNERLRKSLSALQKKVEDSDIISSSIARQLHNKGVLNADLALVEWARQLSEGHCWQEYTNEEICHTTRSDRDSPRPGSQDRATASDSLGANEDMTNIIPDSLCEQLSVQDNSHGVDRSFSILDEIRRGNSLECHDSLLSPLLMAPNGNKCRDIFGNEYNPNTMAVVVNKGSKSPGRVKEQSLGQETIFSSVPELNACLDHSKLRPSGRKRLQRNIGPVIADSQEEIARQALNYARGVPERRRSTPHVQETKRTATITEHTEYSMHSSETYRGSSTVQSDIKNGVRFGDLKINAQYKKQEEYSGSDHESSGLSDPPDNLENFDFTDYLDDFGGQDQENQKLLQISNKETQARVMATHPALSPQPNTSRIRICVDEKEMKPPKSILKRPSSKTGNNTSNNADPSGKPFKPAQPAKLQNTNGGGTSRKSLLRTSTGTSGIQSARFGSSYNRVVSGNRTSHSSNYFQVPGAATEGQGALATDSFTVPSSPAMGQPQRNSKKRTISGVDFSNHKRAAKVQRLDVN